MDTDKYAITKIKQAIKDEYMATKQYKMDALFYKPTSKEYGIVNVELMKHSKEESEHAKMLIELLGKFYGVYSIPVDCFDIKKPFGPDPYQILLSNLMEEVKAIHDYKQILKLTGPNKSIEKIITDETEHAEDVLKWIEWRQEDYEVYHVFSKESKKFVGHHFTMNDRMTYRAIELKVKDNFGKIRKEKEIQFERRLYVTIEKLKKLKANKTVRIFERISRTTLDWIFWALMGKEIGPFVMYDLESVQPYGETEKEIISNSLLALEEIVKLANEIKKEIMDETLFIYKVILMVIYIAERNIKFLKIKK